MMKKVLCAFCFCLLFTGGITYGDGYKVRKSLVAGQVGMEMANIDVTACNDTIVCNGVQVIDVKSGALVELCWSLDDNRRCESGPISVTMPGTHYFTVVGVVDDKEVTYDKWNEDTQAYEPTTYTLPGSTTPPSNEVVLIVTADGGIIIPPPSGCSIRR